MGDVVVLETPQHIDDGVHLADGGEELVAQALSLRRASDKPGDVDEVHPCRDYLFRAGDLRESVEARLRHRHFAHIRLDRAEGIVRRLSGGGLSEGVEECRLADVRQSDDAALEAHEGGPFA